MITVDSTTSTIGLVTPPNMGGRLNDSADGGDNGSASTSAPNPGPFRFSWTPPGRQGNRHERSLTYFIAERRRRPASLDVARPPSVTNAVSLSGGLPPPYGRTPSRLRAP